MLCSFSTAARTSFRCIRHSPARCSPSTRIRVLKTQITFENRHGFAFVSLPRRKVKQPAIVVSFGLSYRVDSPRIWVASEPYPNRWTHHVLVSDEAQLDDVLMGWVKEAAAFAAAK